MNPLFLVGYFAVQAAIGLWLSRRMKTESDYFLGGRRVGLAMTAFSLFATWFGAETCIGSSGQVYAHGLSGSRADPFGFSLCLLLLGLFLAGRLRKGEYVTLADFFRERFGSRTEMLAVWVMVPSSLIWGAAQLRAFGQILSATMGWPVAVAVAASAGIVVLYTYAGGLLGDIYTDFLQGLIMIAGLGVLLVVVLAKLPDLSSLRALTPERLSFLAAGESAWQRFDRWLVPVLGSLVTQESIARVLAARSASVARKACYIACGMYLVVGGIPVVMGLLGPDLLPGVADPEKFLIGLAGGALPTLMFVLFAGALLSAILSTTDSILLACSALVAHNVIFPLFKVRRERARVLIARWLVAASGVLGCLIAIKGGGIYDLVLSASAFGTAGVLVIAMAGLYTRVGGAVSSMAALVAGIVLTVLGQQVFSFGAPFLTAVLGSALAYAAGAVLAPRRAEAPLPTRPA